MSTITDFGGRVIDELVPVDGDLIDDDDDEDGGGAGGDATDCDDNGTEGAGDLLSATEGICEEEEEETEEEANEEEDVEEKPVLAVNDSTATMLGMRPLSRAVVNTVFRGGA